MVQIGVLFLFINSTRRPFWHLKEGWMFCARVWKPTVGNELLSRIGKALEERTLVKDLAMTTDLESKSIY